MIYIVPKSQRESGCIDKALRDLGIGRLKVLCLQKAPQMIGWI